MSDQSYKILPAGGVGDEAPSDTASMPPGGDSSAVVRSRAAVRRAFADDVLIGLSERPKRIASTWFYDDIGSRLFQEITEQEVYYPTASEREIFETHGVDILASLGGAPIDVVDLGAGDGQKTALLLDRLVAAGSDVRYVPIDISEEAMAQLVEAMGRRYETMPIMGLVGEYFDSLRWLGEQSGRQKLVLFLGSNIGNFTHPRARAFLRQLRNALLPGDRVLVGFDLKKDIEILLHAYNDPAGVTARFNLNLLTRINRELGGHFDPSAFRHFATYDVISGAMKSYLVSLREQTVQIDRIRDAFHFEAWEALHTEYSYKYLDSDIEDLCTHAGFVEEARFCDAPRWFCDALWKVDR